MASDPGDDARATTGASVVAQLEGAAVRTPDATLLAPLSWRVRAGEHWVVLGPNGAGKTTLLSLLAARRQPSAGRVRLLGEELGRVDVRTLWPRLGLVGHTIADRVPPRARAVDVVRTGPTGSLTPWWDKPDREAEATARALLARLGCGALADRTLETCSQGERQRVLLARALTARPELLLLDEPAAGLDMPGREALLGALAHAAAGGPDGALSATSVLVTHHLEEIPASTTHGLLLTRGALVAAGPLTDVLRPAPLEDCFGLPVRVERHAGRWFARADPAWSLSVAGMKRVPEPPPGCSRTDA
ncbi:MAG TPA: ATP-binding cassette domain-containing protein [Acidimicrobiia bacterium]|jgi:iron complex transport system ATP-binding protein